MLHDYHTAGGGRFRGHDYFVHGAKDCIPSDRYYLQDASFVAALSGSEELVHRIADAVTKPRWPLYLGRRACPPATAVGMGVVDGDAVDAARAADVSERPDDGPLRLVVEATPEEGGEPRHDVPLSFHPGRRRYAVRYVRTDWCDPPQAEIPTEEVSP